MMSALSISFKGKRVAIAVIALLIILGGQSAFSEGSVRSEGLSRLIDEAVKNNPEIRALGEKVHAFEQRPSQARSIENPRLKISALNLPTDTFDYDQEAMTQKQVSVMQKLPFPGKLGLKGEIAEKELAIVVEEYSEKKNSIIKQLKVTYNNLLFLDRALVVTMENRALLAEAIRTAEIKYAVGQGGQREILKVQMELSRTIKRIITLKQKKNVAGARLNTLLNRPVQNEFDSAGELEQTPHDFTFDELRSAAEQSRPALIGLSHRVGQSRLARNLAEKEYYPDMDFGVSYGQREDGTIDRPDFFSASVTVKIPLWYKARESKKVSEKEAGERLAAEQYKALKNNIYFRIKELSAEIDMYSQEIELFRTGLIPQSKLSYETAVSRYKVNKADFLTLVNSQLSLHNYQIEYYRAIADHENTIAELEETIGRSLSPIEE